MFNYSTQNSMGFVYAHNTSNTVSKAQPIVLCLLKKIFVHFYICSVLCFLVLDGALFATIPFWGSNFCRQPVLTTWPILFDSYCRIVYFFFRYSYDSVVVIMARRKKNKGNILMHFTVCSLLFKCKYSFKPLS